MEFDSCVWKNWLTLQYALENHKNVISYFIVLLNIEADFKIYFFAYFSCISPTLTFSKVSTEM